MNELQKQICTKYGLYLPDSARSAEYLLTPTGILYELDTQKDVIVGEDLWINTHDLTPSVLDFLFDLGCAFVKREFVEVPIGVRIDPTK